MARCCCCCCRFHCLSDDMPEVAALGVEYLSSGLCDGSHYSSLTENLCRKLFRLTRNETYICDIGGNCCCVLLLMPCLRMLDP